LPSSTVARVEWIAAFALSLALILLPWILRLDGKPHADWQQFLGRFHPLTVHLPIVFLLLVPLLEISGAFRPALREAAGFVLGLAFAGCLVALTLGVLLAYGGGESGSGVSRHMAGGVALTIGTLLCLLARPYWSNRTVSYLYPALLTCTMPLLLWTAHQGGSLARGSNYLTAYMPSSVKRHLISGAETPQPDSLYAKQIHPILDSNCVACHGEGKTKGGLRLDSYDALMSGGKDGPVIVAGDPTKSLLIQRVTLPLDHKQFMPAEGKRPLRVEEITIIKSWIQQGASPSATALAGISARDDRPELPLQPVGDYSALLPEILQMGQNQGAKLMQVSAKPEDGLILFTVDAANRFDDAQLGNFLRFAPYIVEAELGRTGVTDACFETLKQFPHLRAVHLEETHITGNGLAKLAQLSQLTYLNLSGTQVTSEAVKSLSVFKNLRHVYLYNTPAQPDLTAQQTSPIARNSP
jgi:uncharacterized membrane protein/mono/diheme cytochrome c family protein